MTQDSLPVGRRADAGGDTVIPAPVAPTHTMSAHTAAVHDVEAPAPPRLTHPTPTMIAWGAVGLGGSLLAGGFRRLTAPAEVTTLLVGVVVVWFALRPTTRRFPAPDRIDAKGAAAWGAVVVFFGLWELYAALCGSTHAHPTLSLLLGPLITAPPARTAGYVVWLAAGVWVVRR